MEPALEATISPIQVQSCANLSVLYYLTPHDRPIYGRLTEVSIGPSTGYTALSYQWESAQSERDIVRILVNEQTFWIRRNLGKFIDRVRKSPLLYRRHSWTDDDAIDRSSDSPKRSVVPRDLQHRATLPLACLITSSFGGSFAMRMKTLVVLADCRSCKVRDATAMLLAATSITCVSGHRITEGKGASSAFEEDVAAERLSIHGADWFVTCKS